MLCAYCFRCCLPQQLSIMDAAASAAGVESKEGPAPGLAHHPLLLHSFTMHQALYSVPAPLVSKSGAWTRAPCAFQMLQLVLGRPQRALINHVLRTPYARPYAPCAICTSVCSMHHMHVCVLHVRSILRAAINLGRVRTQLFPT